MQFFHALAGVFSLLLLVCLGWVMARLGCFAPDVRRFFPRFVTNITLPPFLACTIISSMPRDRLLHLLYGVTAPLLCLGILFICAWGYARLARVNRRHFGLFCASVSNPNTIFIGIPANQALFGPQSLPYAVLYYFGATLFFWTVGNYFISRDEATGPARPRVFHWNKAISPPLYGFIGGMGIVMLDIQLPDFIFRPAAMLGEATTPLALLFIGMTLEGIPLGKLKPGRDVLAVIIGRMVASPLLMWCMLPLFQLPELMGKVFVIQASLPVLMQAAILSAYYNTDPDFGSVVVGLSTLLSIFTIPVCMALL